MTKTKNLQPNKNVISASIIMIMLVLVSAVILLTSILAPLPASSTYADAKTMGETWANFANGYKSQYDSINTNIANGTYKIVSMQDMYAELDLSRTTGGKQIGEPIPGVISDNGATPAKYKNRLAPNDYNYCVTISTAQELLMFSTLCTGNAYGLLEDPKNNGTVSTFFRAANVKLANNINYLGNAEYIVTDCYSGSFSPAIKFTATGFDSAKTAYTTNGLYEGYDAETVPYPFIPVTGFSGIFDGQNFDILNLTIAKNAGKLNSTKYGDTNPTGYDAFFASVATGGVVRNFGLSNVTYTYIPALDSNPVANNIVAGFCGSNSGTITNVYNNKITFESTTQTTCAFVAAGNAATNYYFGAVSITNGATKANIAEDLTHLGTATWYKAANSAVNGATDDRFNNAFKQKCLGGYRLNGLKYVSSAANERVYSINSVADFVTFLHVFKEGFAVAGDSSTSKSDIFVNITQNLDFTFVSSKALIPAIDLSQSLNGFAHKVTLYSGDKSGVGGNTATDLAARSTLSNMRLNTYIENGNDYTSYGIFASDVNSPSAIAVYNLNFVNCNIKVGSQALPAVNYGLNKRISAGIVAGTLKRKIDIRYVSSNGNITAANGDSTYSSNRFGGLVGSIERLDKGKKVNISNFSNISVNGNIDCGARNIHLVANAGNDAIFSVGGIVGYNDSANIGNFSADNIFYDTISVAGNLTGFLCIKNNYDGSISGKPKGSAQGATGGLLGYGAITNNFTNIKSVYISATINNAPTSYTGEYQKMNSYVGGIVGSVGGAGVVFNGLADVKIGGKINIVASVTSATDNTNKITCYAGGITGNFGGGTINNIKTSELFSADPFTLYYFTGATNTGAPNTEAKKQNVRIGNLFGQFNGVATNITNDKSINISGTFSELYIGGIAGSSSGGTINKSVNSAAISSNATADKVYIAGVAGSIAYASNNINNGSVSFTGTVSGTSTTNAMYAVYAGGIIAAADKNTISLNNNINNAEIDFTSAATASYAYVGGICGGCVDSAVSPRSINDCYNFGAVKIGGVTNGTNDGFNGGVGGIIGASFSSGSIAINNSVNCGSIAGNATNFAGGIIGGISKTSTSVSSALNYGAVSGTIVGGIIGNVNITGASDCIKGALNYGAITGATVGGIVGNTSSAVNATQSYSYGTAKDCGSENFKKDTLPTGFDKSVAAATTVPTLAYSDKAFKKSGGSYHSSTFNDTNRICYALTTTSGRRVGKYVGTNYSIDNVANALGVTTDTTNQVFNSLKQKLADCQQIEFSADTFVNFYDDKGLKEIGLYDTVLNQNFGTTSYKEKPNTSGGIDRIFSVTILSSSDYYANKLSATNKILHPGDIKIRTLFSDIFSYNAKFSDTNSSLTFTGEDFDFSKITVTSKLIGMATLKVFQGADSANANYATDYIFKVYFYNNTPTFELDTTRQSQLVQEDKPGDSQTRQNLDMTTVEKSTDTTNKTDTAMYTPKVNNKGVLEGVSASWVYSDLELQFVIVGVDKAAIIFGTNFYVKNADGTYTVYPSWTQYCWFEYTLALETASVADDVAGIPSVPMLYYNLKLHITNRATANKYASLYYLKELPKGSYKFEVSLPIKAAGVTTKTFIRSFIFDKEASGDVYLHNSSDNGVVSVANSNKVTSSFTTLQNWNSTAPADIKNISINNNLEVFENTTPYLISAENYGIVPALGLINKSKNSFLNFYRVNTFGTFKPLAKPPDATISEQKITINNKPNSQELLGFTYSFTITAQDGTAQPYKHTYEYASVPTASNNFTVTGGKKDGRSAEIGKTDTANIIVHHEFANNSLVKSQSTDIMYKDSSDNFVKIGAFDNAGNITKFENSLRLDVTAMNFTVTKNMDNKFTIAFTQTTTGGEYKFVPKFKYNGVGTITKGAIANYVLDVNGTSNSAGECKLELAEFGQTAQDYYITKTVSKNANLSGIQFLSHTPNGGGLAFYYDGGVGGVGGFIDALDSSMNVTNGVMQIGYGSRYIVDNKWTANRYNQIFRGTLNFQNDDGEDYSSVLRFRLDVLDPLKPPPIYYNDEDTNIYVYSNGVLSTTPITKIPYDSSGNMLAQGSTTAVAYYLCDLNLPEGQLVKVRVRAANPLYFNDYEFISDGPLRNKTFNITVNTSGVSAADNASCILSLGLKSTNQLTPDKIVRANSFLYNCNNGTGRYDAQLTSGVYTKTYNSIYNTAGTYVLKLTSISGNYTAKITSVQVANGTTTELEFSDTWFKYPHETAATINIVITITKDSSPSWGDGVFG